MDRKSEVISIPDREAVKAEIRKAFEDPDHKWRTIKDVSIQLNVDPIIVGGAILVQDNVMRRRWWLTDEYTTTDHWERTTPWIQRMVEAFIISRVNS